MSIFWLVLIALGVLTQGSRLPRQIYYEGQGAQSHGRLTPTVTNGHQTAVATCRLVSSAQHPVTGEIVLSQDYPQQPVRITGTITGLSPGYHGFHIHQNGNLGNNCKAAGSHFNPEHKSHGAPQDSVRHAGDLGNIPVDGNGVSDFEFFDGKISLFNNNPGYVLGRSIVVHQKEDDLGRGNNEESKKTGNAGGRVACCIIELYQAYRM